MPFDVEGARKAGYSEMEIADHLAGEAKFDAAAARKSGYSDAEITAHLSQAPAAQPAEPAAPATAWGSFKQGVGDMAYGGAQLMSHALSGVEQWEPIQRMGRRLGMEQGNTPERMDEKVQQREGDYQAGRAAAGDTGTDWWRMGGNTVASIPAALALPAGGSILGALGAGAVTGGGMAALSPVTEGNFAEGKKQQIETGAQFGAATGPLGYLAGRLISPQIAPNVRALHDAGVQMTPGQILGGVARGTEDKLTSIWGPGDMIRGAQRRSVESFNRATANEVLKPLGQALPDGTPAGREMIEEVGKRVSQAYDDAVAQAKPFGPDAQFAQDVQGIAQRFLTPDSGATFVQKLQNDIASRMQGGQITGEAYQTIKSELGRLASQYKGAGSAADRELGEAFGATQDALKGLLVRQNPDAAPLFQRADAAFAAKVRMDAAAGRVGAVDGVFTPAQLSGAVAGADKSARKSAVARGDALLQDFSDPARAVLPSTVPDSGSAGRLAMMLAAGGGGAMFAPGTMAGAAVAGAAYTPMGNRWLQNLMLAQRPGAVQGAGNALAASGGGAAVPLSALLMQPPPPPSLNQRR